MARLDEPQAEAKEAEEGGHEHEEGEEEAEEELQKARANKAKPKRRQGYAKKTPGYGNGPGYWNKRYRKEPDPFEWLEGFEDLQGLIKEATGGKLESEILHVGCGNSLLTEHMYDAGYHRITNIDNSKVAVELMLERNKAERPKMAWQEMDATCMTFPSSSFDVVIDKSVLDTFACGDNAPRVIAAYLAEVQRVLRPRGVFLCVSYGAPDSRIEYLRNPELKFSLRQIELPVKLGGSSHWAYMLRKSAS